MTESNSHQDIWRMILQDGYPVLKRNMKIFRLLPSDPRCRMCYLPFGGLGGLLTRSLLGRHPSNFNPRLCSQCEELCQHYPGGAEVELTMMFADVRGSTTIAEGMSPLAFSQLMDRFYTVSTDAIMKTDGMIEKFVGDEVTALFPPGITGHDHAKKAVEAARLLLQATGNEQGTTPWLPVGAGIHTGVAFVGAIGSGGVVQFAALGDTANTAARLASSAAAGEILVSEAACQAAEMNVTGLEYRSLSLKGRSTPLGVYVLRRGSNQHQ